MTESPAVTVAMTMRNASRYLRECIDSVLAQTFSDFELLIVDDGSTDGSVEIIQSYSDPRVRLICLPHDFIASLNVMLSSARGRYIARMDADDIMLPDRLAVQVAYLDANPEVIAVCSHALRVDASGNPIANIGGGHEVEHITAKMMCEDNHVCNPTTMMRREVISDYGLRYEPDYIYAEDYRFWCRVVSEIGSIDCLPRQLLHYRVSDNQVTARHWDDMMKATERIKADLIDTLVNHANPGYVDPEIPESDHDLTLIIPFLNEGEEVENTVKSFREFGGKRMEIIVINDCSYDSYPYMERLSAIPGVTYILNQQRLGVAGSRDKGVNLCRTPYFLLLDAHMRAYDDSWLTEIPRLLRENDRRILCCQTRFLIQQGGNITFDEQSPQTFGARLLFNASELMPQIKWIKEDLHPENSEIEKIPAVLGAGYAASKVYWNKIGGLLGLKQYGFDEQMLSLKTWLDGGECVLLKQSVLGHIYRNDSPYSIVNSTMLHNSLIVSETLFPIKARCKARAAAFLCNRQGFIETFPKVSRVINTEFKSHGVKCDFTRFGDIILMNRLSSSLDKTLLSEIESRLNEIASVAISYESNSSGLFNGAAGQALWLFLYYKYCNSPEILEAAENALSFAVSHRAPEDISFSTSLSGLGWTLRYLTKIGLINANEVLLHSIDMDIAAQIKNIQIDNYNVSLSGGLGGLLAYACINTSFLADEEISSWFDKAASFVIGSNECTVVEAFYAFLWMQIRKDIKQYIDIDFSPLDWMSPKVFIPKDKKYWNQSFYDGVFATSTIILTQS